MEVQVAKKVITHDQTGKDNGWLMELYKDGNKTVVYFIAIAAFASKGFHLHKVRTERYVCIKGRIRITIAEWQNAGWHKSFVVLEPQDKIEIPTNTPILLENIGTKEALLIDYPTPAYDPDLKDEQVEYSKEELEQGVRK